MRRNNPLPQLVPDRVQKLKARVDGGLWSQRVDLDVRGTPLLDAFTPIGRASRLKYAPVARGSYFGTSEQTWKHRWCRVRIPSPARRGQVRWLHWQCVGETTAFIDGQPWAGYDCGHRAWPLPSGAREVWLDVGAYSTGIWGPGYEAPGAHGVRFDGAHVAVRDDAAWELSCDLDVWIQVMNLCLRDDGWKPDGLVRPPLDRCSPLVRVLLQGLGDAVDAYDRAAHTPAAAVVVCRQALQKLKARVPAESWQPAAAVLAQSHLDLVWLWPESVTRRKAVHTAASMHRLLERYDDFIFSASQPAMYRMLEADAPALARTTARHIAAGRWEALGAFEVEPDNHLPCGEALARSLQIGQAKLTQLTGKPSPVCYLPDVFGYSACLPQLLALAGVEAFFTTKMSWSAVTRFPHSSFVWRGADGSEVLAHLQPTGYTGSCELEQLRTNARDFRQADVHGEMLYAQGLGDGAGGPTEIMIERVRRMADLASVPTCRFGRAVDYFARQAKVRDRLPVWQGEMYLEYHRGTYTSQAGFKRRFRALERALQS
nr:alpha-mannosidase [Planctomycetota bacterium]